MIFWIGILAALFFAWLAAKIGFYEIVTMLFNIVIAVYLGIFLGPTIAEMVGDSSYAMFIGVAGTSLATFGVLFGVSFLLLTGQFTVKFPKAIDMGAASFVGFLTGLLAWGFVALLLSITPFAQGSFGKTKGLDPATAKFGYVCWWSNRVHAFAGNDPDYRTREAIAELYNGDETNPSGPGRRGPGGRPGKRFGDPDYVDPNKPEEAKPVPAVTPEDILGPPPEAELDDIL